jgi:fumarate hydratase, class II
LDGGIATAIRAAAQEAIGGKHDKEFVVDIFQTGSGNSTNMNASEVIANRASNWSEKIAAARKSIPNDHVNRGQSSNDVISTVIHVAVLGPISKNLVPALTGLDNPLKQKAAAFNNIVKTGRTHLNDATPIRLGQEFSGYARQIDWRSNASEMRLRVFKNSRSAVGLVGTGINTHPEFAARAIKVIAAETGLPFREAENHFEAQAERDAAVHVSGARKTLPVSLIKIANDIRWLASGPRCAAARPAYPIHPARIVDHAGQSKPAYESVIQVAAHVIGCDATITICGQAGNFELNVTMPIVTLKLLESIELMANTVNALTEKCVTGIEANEARCRELVEGGLAMVTA